MGKNYEYMDYYGTDIYGISVSFYVEGHLRRYEGYDRDRLDSLNNRS